MSRSDIAHARHAVVIDARVCFWSVMPARSPIAPRNGSASLALADRLDAAEYLASRLPLHRAEHDLSIGDLAIAARALTDGRTLVLAAPRAALADALADAHGPSIGAIHPDALPPWLAEDPAIGTIDPRTLNLLDPALTIDHPDTLPPLHAPAQRLARWRRAEAILTMLTIILALLATGLLLRAVYLRRGTSALLATTAGDSADALFARAAVLTTQRPDPLAGIMPTLLALQPPAPSDTATTSSASPSPTWAALRLSASRVIIDLPTSDRTLALAEAKRLAAALQWPLPSVPAEPIRIGPGLPPIFRLTLAPPTPATATATTSPTP
jgi:hypothetical protein